MTLNVERTGDVGALAGHGLPALCRVSKSYPSSTASVWGVLLQAVYSLYLSTFVWCLLQAVVCHAFLNFKCHGSVVSGAEYFLLLLKMEEIQDILQVQGPFSTSQEQHLLS